MGTPDHSYSTATELTAAMDAGEISAVELTRAAIERIEQYDAPINAISVRDFDRALAAAREADARRARGEAPPLLGVPITIKDSFNVAGLPTTWGIVGWLGRSPRGGLRCAVHRLRHRRFTAYTGSLHRRLCAQVLVQAVAVTRALRSARATSRVRARSHRDRPDGTERRRPLADARSPAAPACRPPPLPSAARREGLPIGVQLIGPMFEDRTPLRFAELLEREFSGFAAPPPF